MSDTHEACPCGSEKSFPECCEPYLNGSIQAATPEAVMRARYTAYATANIDFLESSLHPDFRKDFDPATAAKWAEESEWRSLTILNTLGGGPEDIEGTVEFIAEYSDGEHPIGHHETARFKKQKGVWYFTEGRMMNEPYRRDEPKIGRNDPCPCKSGKKYKKCCGRQ